MYRERLERRFVFPLPIRPPSETLALMKAFFSPAAKEKLSAAVTGIESGTSAEVVVTVRARTATHRDVDYLTGFGFALVALLVLIFDPMELDERLFPLEISVAFVVGTLVSAYALGPVMLSEKRKREAVDHAAKVAFVDQKIAGTTSRCGLLVFASGVEGMVEVVSDVGIPLDRLGPDLASTRTKLESAIRGDDPKAFVSALEGLGVALARELPRREDDVNELPDEVA